MLMRFSVLQTTLPQVKARTLKFIKQWNDQFGSDPSLGVMRELYDSLRARKVEFDGVTDSAGRGRGASAGAGGEDEEERRERIRREEEEELQRVLELSKQDKGGRGDAQTKQGQGSGSGSGSGTQAVSGTSSSIAYPEPHAAATATTTAAAPQPYAARNPTPPPPMPTKATASRVRAIYPFTTTEKGELSFNKGDVIKVIDRMYDEWYTGAVDGRIGIFPVSYVVSSCFLFKSWLG
jgi:signal transducing adaptor molecule